MLDEAIKNTKNTKRQLQKADMTFVNVIRLIDWLTDFSIVAHLKDYFIERC